MATTYEPIATTTLSSAAADITFSSIGSGYTDLRLVVVATAAVSDSAAIQLNGDTATNYSRTILRGDGATASSVRSTSQARMGVTSISISTTQPTFVTVDLLSYAGSTNKTALITASLDQNGSGNVERTVGLWRSTSAITSIKFYLLAQNLAAGTTATLYGILKA